MAPNGKERGEIYSVAALLARTRRQIWSQIWRQTSRLTSGQIWRQIWRDVGACSKERAEVCQASARRARCRAAWNYTSQYPGPLPGSNSPASSRWLPPWLHEGVGRKKCIKKCTSMCMHLAEHSPASEGGLAARPSNQPAISQQSASNQPAARPTREERPPRRWQRRLRDGGLSH